MPATGPATETLAARDARVSWRPFTQAATEPEPLPVRSARGSSLVLEDGTELIDGISSRWSILHGHAAPALVEAAVRQMSRLDHVLFGELGPPKDLFALLEHVWLHLDDDDRTMVRQRTLEGRTLEEIGAPMGLSRERVRQRIERSMRRSRRRFADSAKGLLDPVLTALRSRGLVPLDEALALARIDDIPSLLLTTQLAGKPATLVAEVFVTLRPDIEVLLDAWSESMRRIVRECRRGDSLALKVHTARVVNSCLEVTKLLHELRVKTLLTDLAAIDAEVEEAVQSRVRVRIQKEAEIKTIKKDADMEDVSDLSESALRFKEALAAYVRQP